MPIYDYQCPHCGTLVSERRQIKHRDLSPSCPVCDAWTKRVISKPVVQFKGPGFTKAVESKS